MKDESKLDFGDDPENFPSIWESGEDDIAVTVMVGGQEVVGTTVPIDKIINKHVWLALEDHMKDACWMLLSPMTYEPEGRIVCEATVGLGDGFQRDFNIEAEAKNLGANTYSKDEFIGMAESLERAAQTLRKYAEG